jgi:Photosynthesis system II assembly factor YCF48
MWFVTPMNKSSVRVIPFFFLVCCASFALTVGASAAENSAADWHAPSLLFRVLNTASNGSSLWICGTDETIAVSSDAGEQWKVKHTKTGGVPLLNIAFADDKFGYAGGLGGLFLTTEDGGETWVPHSTGKGAILQISFSDPKHGLIRTPTSLLFTTDGGSNWQVVSEGQNLDDIKHFPYTFSLVALDGAHMAVMMKQGSAQYEGHIFLVTVDSGKSWKVESTPNTTLYSFLRVHGKYWAVGTEVIHKDQPGGGYAVPVALYSSDGEKWEHSDNDLSSCKLQLCVACISEGCLSASDTISDLFSGKTSYREFSPNQALTSKWAMAGATMCFVGNGLQCTGLKSVGQPGSSEGPMPVTLAPGRLGAPASQGPQCIVCSLDRVFIDQKAQGLYTITLQLEITTNGIVTSVVAEGAPSPDIKSRIEQQAQAWIFDPYLKDGVATAVKLNTSVHVNVLKPK